MCMVNHISFTAPTRFRAYWHRLQGEPSNYKFFVTHQKIISTFRPLDKIVAFKQKCKALNMIKVPSVMCESVETLKLKKKNKCTTF
jgi:hypothetical protein